MFTTTQIGAVALFVLSASEDVLGRPLLVTRQNATSSIGNFGSCSVPQIEFATGFDNRKETSFQPVDQTSYNHGSAQNIDIITQFICDTLTNSCGADATAKATCASAEKAADGQTAKTGAQADAFNAVFGITTNFAAVAPVSDQGVTLSVDGATATSAANNAGTTAVVTATSAANDTGAAAVVTATSAANNAGATANNATATDVAASDVAPCEATVTVTVSAAAEAATTSAAASATANNSTSDASGNNASSGTAAGNAGNASAIGDFGSCSVPQIEFGTGFDNRKETAFQPVDQTSFNHGSADNIAVITQFICNTLTNTCGADATAKATCAQAQTAANGATAQTGAQADAFNAVFGITTNFAAVSPVSNTGVTLSAAAGSATAVAGGDTASAGGAAVVSTTAAAAASASTSAAASSGSATASGSASSIGNFGSCSVPQIEFATGFDNRKETSFQPVDQTSYNHGSAQNIDIITQFICDTLTNSCGADATAKATCASAQKAADGQTAKTGAQADAFNAVFGITTNFAAVAPVSDQGVTLTAAAAGAAATA